MRCIRRAFTLVELLTSIAVISILISLLLPAVQSARETARGLQCKNKLRQLGLALHNYHDVHLTLPSGSLASLSDSELSGWGWGAMVLPFIEQSSLYASIDFNTWTAAGISGQPVIANRVDTFVCPSDIAPERSVIAIEGPGFVTVATGNFCGVEGMLAARSSVSFGDVTDGLSQTLLLGERVHQFAEDAEDLEFTSSWIGKLVSDRDDVTNSIPHLPTTAIISINRSFRTAGAFTSRHPGGAQFVFGDGAVQLLSQHMDLDVFAAIGTRNGGEVTSF